MRNRSPVILCSSSISHLNRRSNTVTSVSIREPTVVIPCPDAPDPASSSSDSTHSDDALDQLDHTLSPSDSDSNLSVALASPKNASSLSLTDVDNQLDVTTGDSETLSLTPTYTISDNESVLYSRLPEELHINQAVLDSDLDRLGR